MNDITTLREHLFDTLRDLRNPDKPLDIERAKAINETAQTIINSAKVEVDHMRVAGGSSGFIGSANPALPGVSPTTKTATGTKTVTPLSAGATITTHRMHG